MSTAGRRTRLETTPIRITREDAVFEPETLYVALQRALAEMLHGANLIVEVLKAEETIIIVPDLGSSGLVLKEDVGRVASGVAVVAPHLTADQLGVALRSKDPVEVSAAWAKSQVRVWAKALADATSLQAVSALIMGDVRKVLAAVADGEAGGRTLIGDWLRRCRADWSARAQTLPYLISELDGGGNDRRLPSFCLEMAAPHRIPKQGEFLALNLAAFTKMARVGPANSDIEIVRKVSFAAAAAFLAARYGVRVAPQIHYNDPGEWRRPMESLTDVLRFVVSTSEIMDDPSVYDGASLDSNLNVVVDTDAGTARLAKIGAETSAHAKLALRRGINRPTIMRDPADFLPLGKVEEIGFGIVLATWDALIENEERLTAEASSGWRSRALERALGIIAFRPAPGGGIRGDWQGLRLLMEHCRRTGKNIDDIIDPGALLNTIRRARAHGVDFAPELCEAAVRRARLPAEHPDRLWMIAELGTGAGSAWSGVIGPDLRLVPIAGLCRTLALDNAIEGERLPDAAE